MAYGDVLARARWQERLRTVNAARTMRELERLRIEHDDVARSATTDALTGLRNRRGFEDLVAQLAQEERAAPVGVLLIDVDRFKQINDTFGHDAGDDALRRVAGAISSVVRADDTVIRLGGDEFAVVLPGAVLESATAVAQRAVDAVTELDSSVSVSIGVAVAAASDVRSAMSAADVAMYEAKRAGGGQIRVAGAS